jgi:hypothetical protein
MNPIPPETYKDEFGGGVGRSIKDSSLLAIEKLLSGIEKKK